MAGNLPNAKRPPKALWPILKNSGEYEPTWWTSDSLPSTQRAWTVGNVGHPFVGLPQIPFRATPETALSLLRPFIDKRREPELLSVRVATQLKAGMPVEKADVLAVLQAEAWRQASCFLRPARFLVNGSGKGLCAWDVVLSNLPDPHAILSDTKFALLANHQDAYAQNHTALFELAHRLQKQGAFTLALSQARNAVRVSVLSGKEYDVASAQLSAELCETISSGSLAAAVARRTVQIDRDDL